MEPSFKTFLTEKAGRISGSGAESARHKEKYIDPHVNSGQFTHILNVAHSRLEPGSKVQLHGSEWKHDSKKGNVLFVHATDEQGNNYTIPASKLQKPGTKSENKGHDYENKVIERLKSAGIMPKEMSGAGSTAGTDFVAENKRLKRQHKGKVQSESYLNGETKNGVSAAMGQLTITHEPKKGWHISDKARELRPLYASEVEKSGILEHMNKNHPNPHKDETTASGRAKSITIKHPNLDPGHAYLKDHHVDILQVGGGYGTYRVGDKDATNHGLPPISGKGKWTIREKQLGNKTSRTVMFQPDGKKGLNASHVNIDNDDHLEAFKKTLGHK